MTLLGEYIKKAFEEQTNVPLTSDMNMMAGPLWTSYRQAKQDSERCQSGCLRKFANNFMEKNLCISQCEQQSLRRQQTAVRSLISRCGADEACRVKLQKMLIDITNKLTRIDTRVRYYQGRVREARMKGTPVTPAPPVAKPTPGVPAPGPVTTG
jgi:hypothetical protein